MVGYDWAKFAYDVMCALYDFYNDAWITVGKYLERALDDFTSINTLTHPDQWF